MSNVIKKITIFATAVFALAVLIISAAPAPAYTDEIEIDGGKELLSSETPSEVVQDKTVIKTTSEGKKVSSTPSVVINEFMVNPSSGNEWVELYNTTSSPVNLTGWYLKDTAGGKKILDSLGVIPANNFVVLEVAGGWLNNSSPTPSESVNLYDISDILIDNVVLESPTITSYPTKGESVGRTTDGGSTWTLFGSGDVSKGSSNVVFIKTGYVQGRTFFDKNANGLLLSFDGDYPSGMTDGFAVRLYQDDGVGNFVAFPSVGANEVITSNTGNPGQFKFDNLPVNETYYVCGVDAVLYDVKMPSIGQDTVDTNDNPTPSTYDKGEVIKNNSTAGDEGDNCWKVDLSSSVSQAGWLGIPYTDAVPDVPTYLGFNESGSSSLTTVLPYYSCGVSVNGSKNLSGTWTDVSATAANVRYVRHNIRPNGANDILLGQSDRVNLSTSTDADDLNIVATLIDDYDNFYAGWGGFGLNEGLYQTRVRAYSDLNNNGKYDVNEPISDWSNYCKITYDKTAPVVTVDTLTTNDNTPVLSGSVNEASAIIKVTVSGNTYTAVNNGDGTWTLADDTISPVLADGTYDVSVTATDAAGNASSDATLNELVVNVAPEKVTGITILDKDGNDLGCSGATNNRQITVDWADVGDADFDHYDYRIIEGNIIASPTISEKTGKIRDEDGYYKYSVRAVDTSGNEGGWSDWCGVTLDRTAPVLDFAIQADLDIKKDITNNNGWYGYGWYTNFDKAEVTISVGESTDFVNHQVLVGDVACPAQGDSSYFSAPSVDVAGVINGSPDGIYTFCYYGEDLLGNTTTTEKVNLKKDTQAPDFAYSNIDGIEQSGVYYVNTDEFTADIDATDNQSGYVISFYGLYQADANNNCITTSSIPFASTTLVLPGALSYTDKVGFTSLSDGNYCLGNLVSDDTQIFSSEKQLKFVIDTAAPVPTVNVISTNDSTPEISGTIDDLTATIEVTVDGNTYTAVNNGNGTWILADDTILPALADGVYDVSVSATDKAGNVGTDGTNGELTIDVVAPSLGLTNQTITEGQSIPSAASFVTSNPESLVPACTYSTTPVSKVNQPKNYDQYTVTCSVIDGVGNATTLSGVLTINNNSPKAYIMANPGLEVVQGESLTLTASVVGGDPSFDYSWGGDCWGSSPSANLSTSTAGSYTCSLTVTDADGDVSTASVPVFVKEDEDDFISEELGKALEVKISKDESGQSVSLVASSNGGSGIYTYSWVCNSQDYGTESTLTVDTAGDYNCTVAVADDKGSSANASTTFVIGGDDTEEGDQGSLGGSVLGVKEVVDSEGGKIFPWWAIYLLSISLITLFIIQAYYQHKKDKQEWY